MSNRIQAIELNFKSGYMKKVLVLGGNYLQSDFIQTAIDKGFKEYVLDRNRNCYASRMDGLEFHEIDISDETAVESYYKEYKCDLIISPVTEIGNRIAAKIAARNDIHYNSVDAVKATTDKWVMRNALKKCSLNEPVSEQFSSINEVIRNVSFPLIVKPPVSSASRGDHHFVGISRVYICTEHNNNVMDQYFEAAEHVLKLIKEFEEGRDIEELLNGPICFTGMN